MAPNYHNDQRPVSFDRDVEDIRKSLREVHRTLYKWFRGAETVMERTEKPLDEFDVAVRAVREDVANIRDGLINVTGKFPTQSVYLAGILLLDLLIWALALFLVYKIAEGIRRMRKRRRTNVGDRRGNSNHLISVEEGEQEKEEIEIWWRMAADDDGGKAAQEAVCLATSPLLPIEHPQINIIPPKPLRGILRAPPPIPKFARKEFAPMASETTESSTESADGMINQQRNIDDDDDQWKKIMKGSAEREEEREKFLSKTEEKDGGEKHDQIIQ